MIGIEIVMFLHKIYAQSSITYGYRHEQSDYVHVHCVPGATIATPILSSWWSHTFSQAYQCCDGAQGLLRWLHGEQC